MRDIRLCWLIGTLVVALLSSCGSGATDDPRTHVVEIKQMSFEPATLRVAPGDTVKWINRDLVAHNVTSRNWKSPDLERGEHFSIRVSGEAEYRCTLHPVMRGKIVIKSRN